MRSTPKLTAILVLLAACPGPRGERPDRAADTVTLTILATNDLHGQLEPLLRYTREATPRPYRVAGAEALAATLAELRARDPEGTILLDAGDFMQGSLLSNRHEGAPIRELFALLGYDAVAIGNHEFDFGPVGVPDPEGGDPLGALKAWCARAPFPVVAANLVRLDGTAPWPGLRRSVLLERRGIKLGVIGLTTPNTKTTTMPALVRDLRFEPLLASAVREARALRARGAAAVILLAHGDAECGGEPARCRGEIFELLDAIEPGLVDAVVAGHSHQWLAERHRGIPVIEGCSRGQMIARLELVIDRASRGVVAAASRIPPPLRVCHDLFARTGSCEEPEGERGAIVESPFLRRRAAAAAAARAIVARHQPAPGDPMLRVVAQLPRPIRHGRQGDSEAGELFARALLASVAGADAAVFNAGSVRADLPTGPLRYADLFQAFPFDNKIATATLRGSELRQLLDQLTAHAYGVALVAGLRLELRCGAPPGPRHVVSSLLDGEGRPLVADREYRVVLSDFLLTGGDGLGPVVSAIPESRKQIHPRLVRDAIAEQLDALLAAGGRRAPAVRIVDGPCRHARRGPRPSCE